MYTNLSELTGTRPQVFNLKDSDQLKDAKILILKVEVHAEGEFGAFLVINAKVQNAQEVFDKEIIITTGAADIVSRLVPLADRINGGMAVIGTLHKLGRKWLID